jgi:uncharacterized protein YecE (DUF72 family)
MQNHQLFNIGSCSWKYDSWIGLVYSDNRKENYLAEYAEHYSTVEIDQWFWSLFPGGKVKLPDSQVAADYTAAVPDHFKFSIKVPNSITLTHYYSRDKSIPLEKNPHFLSSDLFAQFLETLLPMQGKVGPLIFQFEYLNRQKMRNQQQFLESIATFFNECPAEYSYAVEIRNPNYLNREYFEFLGSHGLSPVFLQGYYMPSILEVYRKHKSLLKELVVLRLHGPDRKGIEKMTAGKWDRIVSPKDDEISEISDMLVELNKRATAVYLNVNNHYEGSAPATIGRILANLAARN